MDVPIQALKEYLLSHKCQGFTPGVRYIDGAGFLEAFWDDAPAYAVSVAADLVVYKSMEDGRVVGCKIYRKTT